MGPALTGMAFTWGVTKGYVIVPWWLLASIAVLGAVPAWYIVEGEGPTSSQIQVVDDSDDEDSCDEEAGLLPGDLSGDLAEDDEADWYPPSPSNRP